MKSGTNTFHGTAIGNWRNPRFNALTDPTIKRTAGADETNFRGTNLKIYGGTVGGPIIKNKLFTFTSYEHWNDASPVAFHAHRSYGAGARGRFQSVGAQRCDSRHL